jgi:hypothetical protein
MFGAAPRLSAAGAAGRYMGVYVKNSITRYLVLSVAGTAFAAAITFATLAAFSTLISRTENPIASGEIMAGVLALAGFLTVSIAFGITRQIPQSGRLVLWKPRYAVRSQTPAGDKMGAAYPRLTYQ